MKLVGDNMPSVLFDVRHLEFLTISVQPPFIALGFRLEAKGPMAGDWQDMSRFCVPASIDVCIYKPTAVGLNSVTFLIPMNFLRTPSHGP